LHWAAVKGHLLCVQELVKSGSDLSVRDDDDKETSFEMAKRKGFTEIAAFLEDARSRGASFQNTAIPRSHTYIRFFLPFWMIVFNLVVLATFPLLYALPFVVANFLGTRQVVRAYIPDKDDGSNPFFVGIFVSVFSLSCFVYFSYEMFGTTSHLYVQYLFMLLNIVNVPLFLWLTISDPGFVKQNSSVASGLRESVSSLLTANLTPKSDKDVCPVDVVDDATNLYCFTCDIRKPLRSKHCRTCGGCIARMDHHCIWINNCVGAANHRPFMISIALMVVMHCLFVFFDGRESLHVGRAMVCVRYVFHFEAIHCTVSSVSCGECCLAVFIGCLPVATNCSEHAYERND